MLEKGCKDAIQHSTKAEFFLQIFFVKKKIIGLFCLTLIIKRQFIIKLWLRHRHNAAKLLCSERSKYYKECKLKIKMILV